MWPMPERRPTRAVLLYKALGFVVNLWRVGPGEDLPEGCQGQYEGTRASRAHSLAQTEGVERHDRRRSYLHNTKSSIAKSRRFRFHGAFLSHNSVDPTGSSRKSNPRNFCPLFFYVNTYDFIDYSGAQTAARMSCSLRLWDARSIWGHPTALAH
jgi:hypothetical protein